MRASSVAPAALLAAVALAGCSKSAVPATPAAGNVASTAPMDNTMPMTNSAAMNSASPMGAAKTGDSTGVVTAVDTAAGTITLDHQPIPGVGWPAMTMTFKAAPPSLLAGVKTGDKVRFSVRIQGDNNQVTALAKQ
jgi:Cu(I)/Ag(I) efflux system protein CusF